MKSTPSIILELEKPIVQIDSNGKGIDKFLSIKEAAEATGIPYTGISKVFRGDQKSTKGTYWRFLEENELLEVADRKIEDETRVNVKEKKLRIIRIKKEIKAEDD